MGRGLTLALAMILISMGMSTGKASAQQAAGRPMMTGTLPAQPGVSHELAQSRAARIHDVRYGLELTLAPHVETMPGREQVHFILEGTTQADLWLDYREGTISSASVNGHAVAAHLVDGHLLLPGSALQPGTNQVELEFSSPIGAAGRAVTRYSDREDGQEYLYSLFVPMDASMAFPCFDQPDLKARFTLTALAPAAWTVIGNTSGQAQIGPQNTRVWHFTETRPISTYLFAWAAGPWVSVHAAAGMPVVWVRVSQEKRAESEIPQLQKITARGMAWYASYFAQPFPFPKYEMVLIPGFPFGGMEHAGATFLNEDGVLFRQAPTANDRFRRDILTLHELAHQWFGDLVTMRWFDDLWLKEGFAQYMAYRSLGELEPGSEVWKHFYEEIRPSAYGIDETGGTTPIYQDIPNLKDAKSAYGAIVYQKAPAILKQLEFLVGPEVFRNGLRTYLREHAYGNAEWSDLTGALERSGGKGVRGWADAWVLRRGMPEVEAHWTCSGGRLTQLRLTQKDVLADGYVWPMTMQVLLAGGTGQPDRTVRVELNTASAEVSGAIGQACPAYVFANSGDYAYGRFLLDPVSERAVTGIFRAESLQGQSPDRAQARVGAVNAAPNPLLRSQLWGALWTDVEEARSSPLDYLKLSLAAVQSEQDESLSRTLWAHAGTALRSYLSPSARQQMRPFYLGAASGRMMAAPTLGLRIIAFRAFVPVVDGPKYQGMLRDLLQGNMAVPGLDLRPLDRWGMVTRLLGTAAPEADALFRAERQRDTSGDGPKNAYAAEAARPDAAVKARYWADYSRTPGSGEVRPEDWIQASLNPFNTPQQAALTAPYLLPSLQALPAVKTNRRIFFLGAWLNSFLGGQDTPEAAAVAVKTVHAFLASPGLDPDLRLKVLEAVYPLERTVRVRMRFPE